MNSKEALKLAILEYEKDLEFDENNQWIKNVLKGLKECEQDLERLDKLEKENQELKERYKHRAETSNDLCKAVKQYEKAFDIVTHKSVNILILKYCIAKGGGVETYNLHYKTEEQITQEEYELLKEVFGND